MGRGENWSEKIFCEVKKKKTEVCKLIKCNSIYEIIFIEIKIKLKKKYFKLLMFVFVFV